MTTLRAAITAAFNKGDEVDSFPEEDLTKVIATVYSEDLVELCGNETLEEKLNALASKYSNTNAVADITLGFDTPAVKSLKLKFFDTNNSYEYIELINGPLANKKSAIVQELKEIFAEYIDDFEEAEIKFIKRLETRYGKGNPRPKLGREYVQYIEIKIVQKPKSPLVNIRVINSEMLKCFNMFENEVITISNSIKVPIIKIGITDNFLNEKSKAYTFKFRMPTAFIEAVTDKFGIKSPHEPNKMFDAADKAFKDYIVDFSYEDSDIRGQREVTMTIDLAPFYKKFNKSR